MPPTDHRRKDAGRLGGSPILFEPVPRVGETQHVGAPISKGHRRAVSETTGNPGIRAHVRIRTLIRDGIATAALVRRGAFVVPSDIGMRHSGCA
jgi:hypothetical protein